MRISAEPRDHDFVGRDKAGRYEIMLDGRVIRDVIVASEDHNYIIRAQRDECRRLIVNRAGNGIHREVLYGKVRIIDKGEEYAIRQLSRHSQS